MRHLLLLLAGLAQGQALYAAEPPATADVAARYTTTVCGQPCGTPHARQWYFWRGANRVEIRDAGNALGELWKRDGRGRGIYMSEQSFGRWSMRPVLMFVRRAQYQRRLDMQRVVQDVARAQFGAWFADSWAQATRSAR